MHTKRPSSKDLSATHGVERADHIAGRRNRKQRGTRYGRKQRNGRAIFLLVAVIRPLNFKGAANTSLKYEQFRKAGCARHRVASSITDHKLHTE